MSARNKIVKQGDLEINSIARASYLASYLSKPQNDFEANPFSSTDDIAREIVKTLPDELRKEGYLKVERMWVANDLQEHELLEALAYAFSLLAKLLLDSSAQNGPPPAAVIKNKKDFIDRGSFPACMSSFSHYRTVWLNLPTLEIEYYSIRDMPIKQFSKEEVLQKYGKLVGPQPSNGGKSILFRLATQFKEQAKIMLAVDGELLTIAMLLSDDEILHMLPLHFDNNDHKYAMMEIVAQEVERRRATAIIVVGEVWVAPFDPNTPHRRAIDCPKKTEAIQVAALSKNGEEFTYCVPFGKNEEEVSFGEETFAEIPSNFLVSVKKVWAK